MTGNQGDYLMFGAHGEKYPCKKEVFEDTYDVLDDYSSEGFTHL